MLLARPLNTHAPSNPNVVPGHLRAHRLVLAAVIGGALGALPLGFVAPAPALAASSLPDRVCSFAWWRRRSPGEGVTLPAVAGSET